jgi:hypothetical protein
MNGRTLLKLNKNWQKKSLLTRHNRNLCNYPVQRKKYIRGKLDRHPTIWQTLRDKLLLLGATKRLKQTGGDCNFKTAIKLPVHWVAAAISLLLKRSELESYQSCPYSVHVPFNRTDYEIGWCNYNLGKRSLFTSHVPGVAPHYILRTTTTCNNSTAIKNKEPS